MYNQIHTKNAFTLIELISVLAIASILYSIAIPSFQSLIASHQLYTLNQRLFTLIQYTRSKAAFQAKNTILCPSEDQKNCVNDWQLPLMIFIDLNNNKKRDEEEVVDRIESIAQVNYRIQWRASGSSRYLRYVSDGSTVYQNGTFTLCPTANDIQYIQKIIIFRSGRARQGRKHEIKLTDCE